MSRRSFICLLVGTMVFDAIWSYLLVATLGTWMLLFTFPGSAGVGYLLGHYVNNRGGVAW